MHIFKDILDFINTLTFIDYVFFFAVILLLILIITLIYFIKSNNEVFQSNETSSNDLIEITKKLEQEEEKPRIEFTSYEQDQEDKAIISYDELVKKGKLGQINYEDEQNYDGLSIKKISLEEGSPPEVEEEPKSSIRVISYQNEEQFLIALKKLQSLLN